MKPKFLKFDDPDELIGHLHLLDVSAMAVAIKNEDGQLFIIFNDDPSLEDLMNEVKDAADALPVDVEYVTVGEEEDGQ